MVSDTEPHNSTKRPDAERRRIRPLADLVFAIAVVIAVVGGANPGRANALSASSATQAGSAKPSAQARMICATEARTDIARTLGAATTRPLTPTWTGHTYSCNYVYPTGTLKLSVKELPDRAATNSYYTALAHQLGVSGELSGLGQGAFLTTSQSVVVAKDNKVLVVDTTGLPDRFGNPPATRDNVGINVATTIMGCWTGK